MQVILLQQPREELLGQVLRMVTSLPSHKRIQRIPIRVAKRLRAAAEAGSLRCVASATSDQCVVQNRDDGAGEELDSDGSNGADIFARTATWSETTTRTAPRAQAASDDNRLI